MKKIIIAIIIFLVALGLILKTPKKPSQTKLQKVTIMMPFLPSVQWSSYYTAKNKGYYQDEGLDVSFQYSTKGNAGTIEQLVGGKVNFILTGEESIILSRSKGLKIVAVYPIEPTNVYYIISEKNKNITKPENLAGKKISVVSAGGSTYNNLLVILRSANLDKDSVEIIQAGPVFVPAFLEGKFDAVSTHLGQKLQIEEKLRDLNVIKAFDYSDISRQHIVADENLIKSNPELIKKFLLATKKGLEYAVSHPEEAVEIYNTINPDAKLQKKSDLNLWSALIKEFHYKTNLPELEKSENWKKSQEVLFDIGSITQKTDVTSMFTNKFAP